MIKDNEEIELEEIPEVNIMIEQLFEDYEKLNELIRKQLPFSEYLKLTFQDLITSELLEGNGEEKNEIPQKNLCKQCKKEEKYYMDRDFCTGCIEEKTGAAEKRKEEIEKELENDSRLNGKYSESKKIAYIVDKYKEEEKENKYLRMKTFAKQIVDLIDIKN
jgi:hypothetical protein